MDASSDVLIIGAGASGTLVAANLLLACGRPLSVTLVGSDPPGTGVAYGTTCDDHLLNVPASGMSVFVDRPSHFLEWAREHVDASEGSFLSRRLYARYLNDVLDAAERAGERSGASLNRVTGRAVSTTEEADGQGAVVLEDGRELGARRVILALGNFPPARPQGLPPEIYGHSGYIDDPWVPDALDAVYRSADVLLIGTGLTMYDVFLDLLREGRGPRCIAISRNGLRPEVHALKIGPPPESQFERSSTLNDIAQAVQLAADDSEDWRARIDSIRPLTPGLWRALSLDERKDFLSRWRRQWDVKRHRAAPEVDAIMRGCEADGRLEFLRAELHDATLGDRIQVTLRTPDGHRDVVVDHIINCTGPNSDYRRIDDPLVNHLRERGTLTPDPLGLGIETAGTCALIDAKGKASDVIYAVGPPTKPNLWEITAIPEIRQQAAALAVRLLDELDPGQVPALV